MFKPVVAVFPALTALVAAVGRGPAMAAPPAASDSTAALYACAEKPGASDRLSCFDAEVARLKAAEAGGELAVVSREDVRQAERGNFGLSGAEPPALAAAKPRVAPSKGEEDEKLREVTVTVVKAETRLDGRLRFTTSDGQVWVQTDSTDARVRGDGPWEATIKAGMIGSYMIKLDGARAVKVRREQ